MNLDDLDDDEIIDDSSNLNADGNVIVKVPDDDASTTKSPAFDPTSLATAVSEAVATQLQAHASSQPAPQMTPQQLAEHYAIWDPNEGFINGLNALTDADATPAQKKKIFEDMRDGIMQQAFRASQLVVAQETQKMRAELAPAVQYAQQRQAKNVMKEFVTKYPALNGQTELVDAVIANLAQQNFKPKSKDEAYEKVAKIAEKILQGVNPQFSLKTSGGSGGKPGMASTNMGGVGGGGKPNAPVNGERGKLAAFWQR